MSDDKSSSSKLLILCVDRDDDIGVKAQFQTPIMGRRRCLSAATKLAVADPEEADANAIFGAIRQHDELLKKGYECEVAVVSGFFNSGVEADRRISDEVRSIQDKQHFDGIVFISDGVEDETVLPILQGIVPVVSVRRIIIKHSKTLEESYAVFGRYLRMLAYDSRYSKFALGIPGLLLVVGGLLVAIGYAGEALIAAITIVGAALILRGFDLDRLLASTVRLKPLGLLKATFTIASLLVITSAFLQSFVELASTKEYAAIVMNPQLTLSYVPFLVGTLIQGAMNLTWIGLSIFFGGAILYNWGRRSFRIWRHLVGLIILMVLYLPILQFTSILINPNQASALILVSYLLISLAATFGTVTVVIHYFRNSRRIRGAGRTA
tara:strand:- start:152 stop:1291 length:1140 start_codon:yes stop_codon:yes gene_type:complete